MLARRGSFLFVAADASSPHLRDTLLSAVLGACRSGVLRGVNAHREPTKSVARVEDVPRAVILLVVTNFSCRRVFFSSVVVAVGDEAGRLLSFPGSAHHFEVGSGACNSRILDEMLPISRKSEEIPV